MKADTQSLVSRCSLDPATGCWVWERALNNMGYGVVKAGGRMWLAHRLSFTLYFRPIEQGENILHRCDNPMCINPEHLSAGTQMDNIRDMYRKERAAVGERHGSSKLTEDDIRAIRSDVRSQRIIAADYSVTQRAISMIKRRERWSHVK